MKTISTLHGCFVPSRLLRINFELFKYEIAISCRQFRSLSNPRPRPSACFTVHQQETVLTRHVILAVDQSNTRPRPRPKTCANRTRNTLQHFVFVASRESNCQQASSVRTFTTNAVNCLRSALHIHTGRRVCWQNLSFPSSSSTLLRLRRPLSICLPFLNVSHVTASGNGSPFHISTRTLSTDNRGKIKPVFVAVPNPIRAIRNFVYSCLIRGYFDKEFSMKEFSEGAKQAVSTVSQKISEGQFDDLSGLLSPKTIEEIKQTYDKLGMKQRGSLAIELEDILHVVPYNVAVHYDQAGGKFLNILMRFWCLSFDTEHNDPGIIGFKVGRPPPDVSDEQFKNMGKVFTCTFEFHRDVSTDTDPSWTITQVTLGKLLSTPSDGFPGDELE